MHLRDGEDITADEVTAEPYFNSNLLISMETNDKFPFLWALRGASYDEIIKTNVQKISYSLVYGFLNVTIEAWY